MLCLRAAATCFPTPEVPRARCRCTVMAMTLSKENPDEDRETCRGHARQRAGPLCSLTRARGKGTRRADEEPAFKPESVGQLRSLRPAGRLGWTRPRTRAVRSDRGGRLPSARLPTGWARATGSQVSQRQLVQRSGHPSDLSSALVREERVGHKPRCQCEINHPDSAVDTGTGMSVCDPLPKG